MEDEWTQYSKHILKTLERLERKTDSLGELLTMANEDALKEHSKLSERIGKVESDVKWYARVSSMLGVLVASVVNIVLSYFKGE